MPEIFLMGIKIGNDSIIDILNKINRFFLGEKQRYCHIVNLNTDTFATAYKQADFRKILNCSDITLIDGVGIKMASHFFAISSGERMTGTDLMMLLVKFAHKNNLKVMFLGGVTNTAKLTGKYFKTKFPRLNYEYDRGAIDIKSECAEEKHRVLTKIKIFKPDFLFVAYGPPHQELWIHNNRISLKGVVCMGVGGSFNFFSGIKKRAPNFLSTAGFEWLWRFIFEPKRLITKLPNHIYFTALIVKCFFYRFRKKYVSSVNDGFPEGNNDLN